jgi:peptidyl-prolyl cis-trans isomerase C
MLLASSLVLIGCNKDAEGAMEGEEAEEAQYTMGAPLSDSTLAVVVSSDFGGDTLTAQEYFARFNMIVQQYPTIQQDASQTEELQRTIVENFILEHLITGEADRLNLQADTAQVNQQLGRIRSQFPNEEAYQQALASEGVTEDSLRGNITEFVRQQMLQERFAEGAVNPNESELTTYRQEQAEEVRAQHILFLLPPGTPEQQQDSVQTLAEAVLDTAKSGAVPFDELARRYSQDGSAQAGGDLNYFRRGAMVPPFEEAAFALADSGDVAPELVRTQFGYHIIRLTDRRTGELMDTTRARQMLLTERRQEAVENEVERLKETVTVQVNPAVIEVDINAPREEL